MGILLLISACIAILIALVAASTYLVVKRAVTCASRILEVLFLAFGPAALNDQLYAE